MISKCPKCRKQTQTVISKKGVTSKGMGYVSGPCSECGVIKTRFTGKEKPAEATPNETQNQ